MREMKDSGIEWIGEIPEIWRVSKLKYLGEYINGYAFKPEDWGNNGKRIIRIQDLTGSNDNPNFYDGEIPEKYHVKDGDILVSWAATLDAFVWNKGEGLLNQHIFKAIPYLEKIDYNYFFWMIKEAMKNMNNDNKHGIFMQHVTLDVFNNFSIPMPSIEEQSRIANYLDYQCTKLDNILTKTRASIEEYKKLKQAIITQAVTKGVRSDREMKDSGNDFIGMIPCDWEVCKFGRCITIKSNLVAPEKYLSYPQIAPDNIEKGAARLLNNIRTVEEVGVISWNHLFHKGQILYSKIRPMLSKLVIAPFDGLCSADMYPIETENDTEYIVFLMLSDLFLSQVGLVTINRVKMPKINQIELANIRVPLPEIEEQREIAEYLKGKCMQLDEIIDKKEKYLAEMENYKKSLIYEYVTGKKEVPEKYKA